MAGVWKRDGTVAVTNGNKKVTGTGTTFADTKNGVAKGHLFCITSGTSVDFYEVDYVVSNTELYLVQAYRGVTATGKAYEIITTFSDSVPEFARRLTATLSAYQQQSDAFQALLTSTATTVEVTAPDGTKQTLIPWKRVTSEGEGQAARAKTEADKAAASAALAGDIVAASALPLPDVWAPLTDSLRLFTGYGREVKVGEDVVARMVNFSRNSIATYTGKDGLPKTAAANEPRFEKEGLLLEGQSTNLFLYPKSPDSYPWSANGDNTSYIKITDGVRITGIGYYSYRVLPVASGQIYTFSVTCKVLSGALYNVGLEGDAPIALGSGLTPEDGTVRLSGTVTPNVNGHATCVYYPTQNSVVEFTDIQFEALPYATSPIHADGAAATRAADIASLPQSLNLGESQLGFSLAVDFDSVNPGQYRVISLSDYSTVMGDGANIYIRHAGREIGPFPAQLGKRNRLAYTVDLSGAITACINGVQITAQSRIAAGPRSNEKIMFGNHINTALNLALEGHLRDLKIWTKTPLTVEQLKVASA
ncbi:hypothetical protein [Aeromonas caviae]|uniref:phage head spike fiber domain-containing protein n=1 Tax=Aeromonas caviae TaxID=648 RepID=UPI0015DBD80A|nr:hypothetical protein [Aeromonas caviae]BBS17668.1 hypothetical protein WP5W18E02_27050 [Aeromonas caviae]